MSLAAGGENWLNLSQPLWAIALPACLLPILLARHARRRGRRVPTWATVADCLSLALVVAALTGPKAPLGAGARLDWLVLTDASGSVRGQPPPDWPEGIGAERWAFAEGLSRTTVLSDAATDIAPPLWLIGSRTPAQTAGAVIATDGRFTDTGWEGPARAVAAAGIETLIVPMNAPPPDARIARLTARRQGGQVRIAVAVIANAPLRRTLTVSRADGREPLFQRTLSLLPESPATFHLTDALAAETAGRYTARITPGDPFPENDSARTTVPAATRTIAAAGPEQILRRWLAGPGRSVRFLGPVDRLPTTAEALAGHAGLIVLDPTGEAMTKAQRRAVGRYVESGGGLVLLGTGPSATPADRDDPLNRVAPLTPDPFRRRPLQLTVLLDHSGSMAADAPARPGAPVQRKFDLAAEAVVALAEHLTARDALTVITFADRPFVAYRREGTVDVAALRRSLASAPTGATNVTPAIAEALSTPPAAGRKPMLLILSDLQTEPFPPAPWARKLRDAGVHLAVVAIAQVDADAPAAPLEALTRLAAGAQYIRRTDVSGLAEVFARLVRRGRGSVLREDRTSLVITGPLFDTPLDSLPDVDAYLLMGKRPGAELLAATAGGEPILARRQAGLGRSVWVALPLEGHNAAWRRDGRAAELIWAAVQWTAHGGDDPRFDVRLAAVGDEVDVTANVRAAGAGVNGLKLTACAWADGVMETAALDQVAPGRYAGRVAAKAGTAPVIAIRDEGGVTLWRGPAPGASPAEFRSIGADRRSLDRLADLTGGRVVPASELAGIVRQRRGRRLTPLWPMLLAAAVAMMLTEWCIARVTQEGS